MQRNAEALKLPSPEDLRKLASTRRDEARELKSGADPRRLSMSERDARALEDEAEALEREAEHAETHAETPALFELVFGTGRATARGNVYEVEREDGAGFSELGYGSLQRCDLDTEAVAQGMRDGRLFVFVPDHATGSDYGGDGAVSKSNAKALEELAKSEELESVGFWTLSGGHNTYGVAFSLGVRCAELLRVLEGLSDYPLIDEELHSETEAEEQAESWTGYAASDFRRTLESEHALDLSEVEDSALFELFETARERANVYWTHESDGASIDVERVASEVERSDALGLAGAKRDSEDVEAEAEALAQLRATVEPFAALQLEALKPEAERNGAKLSDCAEAARVALGSPSESVLGFAEGFLAQVARWPVSEQAPPEDATPEAVREALRLLREHVGAVVRGAREELERLRPARYARELERESFGGRKGFGPLPVETRKRD